MTNLPNSKRQLVSILMKNRFRRYEDAYYGFFKNELDVYINDNGVLCIFNRKNGILRETGFKEIVLDMMEIIGETLLF